MKKSISLLLCNMCLLCLVGLLSTTTHAQTFKYTYDELGRMTFVEDPTNGNRTYNYDPAGNRTRVIGFDSVAPSNPSALTVQSITGSSAFVSWTASTDNVGINNYEYSLNGGAWISNNNSTGVNLTGLTSSTSYTFALRARDYSNNLSGTVSTSFKTTFNAPTGLNCYLSNGPGAWKGTWNTVPGADHYVFRLIDTYAGSYPSNEPNNAIRVYGTLTNILSINTSTKVCKWVQACDANNVCGAQAYF